MSEEESEEVGVQMRPVPNLPFIESPHHPITQSPNHPHPMCRNIRTLFNFDPPADENEIRAASLQFVRKISGFAKPSKANEEAFASAVEQVSRAAAELLRSLEAVAPPKNREQEAAKAKARASARYGS